MSANLIAKVTTTINAPVSRVWEAITTPALIKKYFFGTDAISDWEEGSELKFRGVWEGRPYEDKGTILKMIPNKLLQHTYFSSFSGLEDAPENYTNVIYELEDEDGQTQLTVKQENTPSEEARERAVSNWETVLQNLKEMLESEPGPRADPKSMQGAVSR